MSGTIKWRIAQGLEIRWWRKYLKGKDVAGYLQWKKNYWLDFVEQLNKHVAISGGQNILDAGCGPAGIFTILDKSKVIAIDPLIHRYQEELEHFNPGEYPNVSFRSSTIEEFDSDEKFDVIFCLNAINHVADIDRALDNLFRNLHSEGKLVLSIDCHKYSTLKNLFRSIPGDALHPHQDGLQDYRRMIAARGGNILLEHLSKPGRIFDYYVLVIERT